MASNNAEAAAPGSLVRGIGRWDLVAVVINGVIGAGIFGLPGKIYSAVGIYSLLSFIVCAAVISLIVLCFAEVASRFRDTGGPYLYARESFGPVVGFEVGWMLWVTRATAFAANVNLLIEYLSYFWPAAGAGWTRPVFIACAVILYATINIIGVRSTALFSDVFTLGKLLVMAFFIAIGFFFLAPENFASSGSLQAGAFANSVLLLVYAFSGFEIAVVPAAEIRDPQRNLPFALITAMAIIAAVYIVIQIVCIGTLPELADSSRPLVDASSRFMGRVGASVVTAGVLISVAGNLSVVLLAGSRLPFAMASRGELPQWLAATHPRFHTPHRSILLTSGVVLALSISGSFIYALTISTLARLTVYAVTCAALPILRNRERDLPARFRAPAGNLVAVLSMLLVFWLFANSSLREARDAALAAALGLVVYYVYRAARPKAAERTTETKS